ncbi:uncharacterized protein [Montipora capricornis]|uniref:uncharacterized protein n=1 Tax=Montipora capricornis TaxID=246305 RepID=UPI0035F14BFA
MAVDLTTMEFLQVLRRFLAIRRRPEVILSDNGSQFVGAEKELHQIVGDINEEEVKEFCGEKWMQWKNITPGAPHQNGCAEAPVKTCKSALKKAVGSQKIIDSFWKRWNRDLFPSLVPSKKWQVERRNVRPDDIVVVSGPNALRGKWSFGRVLEVHPGPDGPVRNVEVKTSTGMYSRPITKIAVIHPAEGDD